ncbi:hypothetical protein NE237_026686 [Protea cynaroides]|uniref:Uncharacterized protein n=1 Tax=Protea cynaroides TaxID=273540 RepID=A0A9Q0H7K9_9MAGN|nr:hypothetical protein NE237_026686 [Protea cynaroides]
MKEERKGDTESVVRWWDYWRNSKEKNELGFPKRLRGEREAHHGECFEKEIVGHGDCESRVQEREAAGKKKKELEKRLQQQTENLTPSTSSDLGCEPCCSCCRIWSRKGCSILACQELMGRKLGRQWLLQDGDVEEYVSLFIIGVSSSKNIHLSADW